MPTLLAVNNYHYRRGGAETIFLEHNRRLTALGWEVIPFAMRHPMNEATPWERYFVEEIEWGQRYSPAGAALRAAKTVYSWEARRRLRRLLGTQRPHLCHVHNLYHHISPSILGVLRAEGIPVVLTVHDLKLVCPAYQMLCRGAVCERCKGGLHHVVLHRCLKGSLALSTLAAVEAALHRGLGSYTRSVDRFIVPSRFYLEKLVEWGWERERFVHLPNFVDIARHRPRYPLGEGFLYFGRLGREKGLETLIRAAALAGVALRIAGSGDEQPRLAALAEAEGADVTFLGRLEGQALQEAVWGARATVLPSEWYENAPVSVLESYALGRPVIGAAIGGIPELVRDGETGMLFPSGSVEGLAAALRSVESMDSGRLSEMGRTGRQWVEQEFSVERYLERMLELYGALTPLGC